MRLMRYLIMFKKRKLKKYGREIILGIIIAICVTFISGLWSQLTNGDFWKFLSNKYTISLISILIIYFTISTILLFKKNKSVDQIVRPNNSTGNWNLSCVIDSTISPSWEKSIGNYYSYVGYINVTNTTSSNI